MSTAAERRLKMLANKNREAGGSAAKFGEINYQKRVQDRKKIRSKSSKGGYSSPEGVLLKLLDKIR